MEAAAMEKSYVQERDSEHGTSYPIEMSQYCIEWDDSSNKDLRSDVSGKRGNDVVDKENGIHLGHKSVLNTYRRNREPLANFTNARGGQHHSDLANKECSFSLHGCPPGGEIESIFGVLGNSHRSGSSDSTAHECDMPVRKTTAKDRSNTTMVATTSVRGRCDMPSSKRAKPPGSPPHMKAETSKRKRQETRGLQGEALENRKPSYPLAPKTRAECVGPNNFRSLLKQIKTPSPMLGSNPQVGHTIPSDVYHHDAINRAHLPKTPSRIKDLPSIVVNSTGTENAESTPVVPQHKEISEPNEEFGDMVFSTEDLEKVDFLVSEASQGWNKLNAEEDKENSRSRPESTVASSVVIPFSAENSTRKTAAVIENENNDDEDPFGFFPMIDFDELDKTLAEQEIRKTTFQSETKIVLPPYDAEVNNPINPSFTSEKSSLEFTRYVVSRVEVYESSYTKVVYVVRWTTSMLQCKTKTSESDSTKEESQQSSLAGTKNDGVLFLRGEWYYSPIEQSNILHLCSLSGEFRTDPQALPITLHTAPPPGSNSDDLVVILHPDLLLTPTSVSETLDCSRRAVIRSRLGSTGLKSVDALYGTMRHALFEQCLKENNFSRAFIEFQADTIVRRNAENLYALGLSSSVARGKIVGVCSQFQAFEKQYTSFSRGKSYTDSLTLLEGHGMQQNVRFRALSVLGVEVPETSPELGLKGNIDVVIHARMQPCDSSDSRLQLNSMMSIELKTGHNQNTHKSHMAQLALYSLMLQAKHGTDAMRHLARTSDQDPTSAAKGGMLLYLNEVSMQAVHVAPVVAETKSLIGQRNLLASEIARTRTSNRSGSSKIQDLYRSAEEPDISSTSLPELLPASQTCKRCFTRWACTTHAAAESSQHGTPETHKELIQAITGHLGEKDFDYFRDWNRLIDLEAATLFKPMAEAWLTNSDVLERSSGTCISSLVFDMSSSVNNEGTNDNQSTLLCFERSKSAPLKTPFTSLDFNVGCSVVISTNSTTVDNNKSSGSAAHGGRSRLSRSHNMHIVCGWLEKVEESRLEIRATKDDLDRLVRIHSKRKNSHKAPESNQEFRLDRNEKPTIINIMRQNVLNLFTIEESSRELGIKKERLSKLRQAVVDLTPPRFDESLGMRMFTPDPDIASIPGCDIEDLVLEFTELNNDQRQAVEKVFAAQDYTLIQGLPGSGKTSTIAFLARLLAAHGKRVLITSYTHSAVDNVLMKLIEKGAATSDEQDLPAVVRIGNSRSCHKTVQPQLVSRLASIVEGGDLVLPSVESITLVMNSARIIGATILSVPRSPLLVNEHFDVVIVDEAGQISQPATLGGLLVADKFVLVGDHKQLPPLVHNEIADKGGLGVSMLQHLAQAHEGEVQQLRLQYRMNGDICQLSNDIAYNGQNVLKCANSLVEGSSLHLPGFKLNFKKRFGPSDGWLQRVVDPGLPVAFVNTDELAAPYRVESSMNSAPDHSSGALNNALRQQLERTVGRQVGGNVVNDTEAGLVRKVVEGFLSAGLQASSIGIICPFRAQIRLLEDCETFDQWKDDGLEICTIDRFQGRDKAVIILTFVRSNSKGKVGRLLEDVRRINVAITRAKSKLVMIGSFATLHRGSKVLRPALDRIRSMGRVETLSDVVS